MTRGASTLPCRKAGSSFGTRHTPTPEDASPGSAGVPPAHAPKGCDPGAVGDVALYTRRDPDSVRGADEEILPGFSLSLSDLFQD